MDGVINLLKPPGMTSHDVVAAVRGLFPGVKAGHTGTLDPAAVGVLVVCLGRTLKLGEHLFSAAKAYRFVLQLGIRTDTQDADGEVVERSLSQSAGLLAEACAAFRGEWDMAPPVFSAARVSGRRSYDLAREGKPAQPQRRRVTIGRLELLRFEPSAACALLEVECSKGTYVRTLCDELGQRLGCGGHLRFLLRTVSGTHRLADAVTFEELRADPASYVQPISTAVGHLPEVRVAADALEALRAGNPVPAPAGSPVSGEVARVHGPNGELACLVKIVAEDGEPKRRGRCSIRAVKVLR